MFLLNAATALLVLLAPLAPADGVASAQGKRRRAKPVTRQQQQQKKAPTPPGDGYLGSEEREALEREMEGLYSRVLAENGVPETAPDLIRALRHDFSIVKIAAAHTLGKKGERGAIPALRRLLADPDPEVKIKAVEVLHRLGDASGFRVLVEEAKNKDARIRLSAVATGARFAASAADRPQAVALLAAALRDEDKDVRGAAAAGLGDAGDRSAVPELQRALGVETDVTVRLVIEQQLRKLGQ
jgi:HEAT repeat protein